MPGKKSRRPGRSSKAERTSHGATKPERAAAKRSTGAAKARPEGPTAALRDFCRALPGTTEDIKWDHDLVFSIGKKMYAAFDLDDKYALGFKCDDEDFDRLVELGERAGGSIIPAPYAARYGWVAIRRKDALPGPELRGLLRKSYELVKAKLPGRVRRELEQAARP